MKTPNLIHWLARQAHVQSGMLFPVGRPDPALSQWLARSAHEGQRPAKASARHQVNWFLEDGIQKLKEL